MLIVLLIIGIGGISCVEDIIEFLLAGASMVQIGTLNYKFPNAGVSLYLELKNKSGYFSQFSDFKYSNMEEKFTSHTRKKIH